MTLARALHEERIFADKDKREKAEDKSMRQVSQNSKNESTTGRILRPLFPEYAFNASQNWVAGYTWADFFFSLYAESSLVFHFSSSECKSKIPLVHNCAYVTKHFMQNFAQVSWVLEIRLCQVTSICWFNI